MLSAAKWSIRPLSTLPRLSPGGTSCTWGVLNHFTTQSAASLRASFHAGCNLGRKDALKSNKSMGHMTVLGAQGEDLALKVGEGKHHNIVYRAPTSTRELRDRCRAFWDFLASFLGLEIKCKSWQNHVQPLFCFCTSNRSIAGSYWCI